MSEGALSSVRSCVVTVKRIGQWSETGGRTVISETNSSTFEMTRPSSVALVRPVGENRVGVSLRSCSRPRSSRIELSWRPPGVEGSSQFHCESFALKSPRMTRGR